LSEESQEAKEIDMILKAIFTIVNKTPATYNKKDIGGILSGKKKGSRQTYKFKISQCRLSGILDTLEAFKTLSRNEKGLYSMGKKEAFTALEMEA
jgi:hypothetical protein